MKKFLLGIVFIIPIIVMIAITAATSIIATVTSPLPDEILLYNMEGVLLKDGDIVELEITDEDSYVIAEILPVLVKDDSVDFTLDEESGDGRLSFVRREKSNRYTLIPKAPGAVSVTVRASANVSVVRYITFIINTKEITGVDIFDDNGEYIEEISLIKQERVYAEVAPIVALAGYNLTWKSSDESIVKVSPNGFLYPIGRGRAYVSLSALDKLGNIHTDSILVDTTRALVTSDNIYTSTEITMSWIKDNLLLSESSALDKDVYTRYTVSGEGNTVTLNFIFCAPGDWGFTDNLDIIYTRHVPYFAEVCYLETRVPLQDVELVSEDPEICAVDGLTLIPKKSGTATITASYDGVTKSKTVTVRDNPAVLSLTPGAADAKRGIKLTRVWGLYTYRDGALETTYQMGTVENADVIWKTDDPVKATVTPDGLVTFNEESRGRKVVVTASTTVYGKPTGISRSFTFNILNENAVNVYSYNDLDAVNNRNQYALVLQSDMESGFSVCLRNSIYGNGFTVSAEVRGVDDPYNQDTIFYIQRSNTGDQYDNLEAIVVEDIVLEGRKTLEQGTHVGIGCYDTPDKIIMRHVIAKNFYTGISIYSCSNVLIEGCIIGDNQHHAVNLAYRYDTVMNGEKVVLRNNVLKMSVGPAAVIVPQSFESSAFGKSFVPDFTIEGFLDIYNWKTESEVGPAFNVFELEKIDLGGFIDPQYLANTINDGLTDLMQSPEMAHLFYTDDKGDRYASMGVFVLGAMFKQDKSKIKISDPNLSLMTMPLSNVSGGAGMILDIVNAIASSKGMPINNDCYFIGYNFTNHEPLVKPGDAVPQNYELYHRLQGKTDVDDTEDEDEYEVC